MNVLVCQNITFQYPGTETYVFKDLTCQVPNSGFHALFGPSGVGKTTLARMMAGEMGGFLGDIRRDDMNTVLYSYNLERLPGWYSVGNHLEEVTPDANKQRIQDVVRSFGLEACTGARFSQLSLGQQNRINLARYLLQDFDLLIMDESLANVDEATREQIIFKIKEMFSEKSFLYISHNVLEISRFCDEVLVLRASQKTPQVISVRGQGLVSGQSLKEQDLELTMLEIMHAA
jgi:ABC-type multidrug transport system ATPase subunit